MISNLSFTSTEVLFFTTSIVGSVLLFIMTNRSLLRDLKSYEFNIHHFLLGVILSLATCIIFFNWETQEKKYQIYSNDEKYEDVTIPLTTWKEEKKELVLPPSDKTEEKLIIPKEVFEIKAVEDLKEVEEIIVADQEEKTSYDLDSMMVKTKEVIPPPPPPSDDEEEEIIAWADQMPRFPGCEDIDASSKEKEACATRELLQYIYDNLKYPPIAIQNTIEGQVVVRFVVEKDGSVTDVKIARDIGGGCGNAALNAVNSMNDLPEKWTPGKQRGKQVRVRYTLPIVFKLQ